MGQKVARGSWAQRSDPTEAAFPLWEPEVGVYPFFISSVLFGPISRDVAPVCLLFQQVNVIVSRKYDVLRCGKLTEVKGPSWALSPA